VVGDHNGPPILRRRTQGYSGGEGQLVQINLFPLLKRTRRFGFVLQGDLGFLWHPGHVELFDVSSRVTVHRGSGGIVVDVNCSMRWNSQENA